MKKGLKLLLLAATGLSLLTGCNEHVHNYDLVNATWDWTATETGYTATCTAECLECDSTEDGHKITVDAKVTSETIAATCTTDGKTTYTAKAILGKQEATATKIVDIAKFGHQLTELVVNSDYKKEYSAFEKFDTSTLTVKATCSNCHEEFEVSDDEYFLNYETFGADCFHVGDTKVTIAYQGVYKELNDITVSRIKIYKPQASTADYVYTGEPITYFVVNSDYYTVTGNVQTDCGHYTVVVSLNDKDNYSWEDGTTTDVEFPFNISKNGNVINGFESHYVTSCHTEPNYSGVSSTAGTVTYKYYLDAEHTNEVAVSELTVGNYYIVATSETGNYEKVTKEATLEVIHVYDQENTSEEYLASAATEGQDARYYHSCKCGTKGSTTFALKGSKILPIISASSVESYQTVNMAAPTGFTTVTKGTVTYSNDDQGHTFLKSLNLNAYETVKFAFMTKNRRLVSEGWAGNPFPTDEWAYVEITRNGAADYTSTVKNSEGTTYITYTGFTNFNSALLYYNYDGDAEEMEWYSTEVRADTTDTGLCIDETAISGNSCSYTSSTMAIPEGFNKSTEFTPTQDYFHGQFFSALDLSTYKEVRFAIRSTGWFLLNHSWGGDIGDTDVWYIFYLTRADEYSWDVKVLLEDGTVKYQEAGLNGYYEGEYSSVYTSNSLNAILYGCSSTGGFVMSHKDGVTFTVYATEVRGIRSAEPEGIVIADSSVSEYTEISDGVVATGFNTVTQGTVTYDNDDQGHTFLRSDLDISIYSKVRFAFKTLNRRFCHYPTWGGDTNPGEWYICEYVKDTNGTFTVNVKTISGTVKFSYENIATFGDGLIYCNYGSDYDCVWISSEVRAFLG